jgi:ribonuclease R
MNDRTLLDHISRLPHGKVTFKQLVRELGAKGCPRAEIELALERLSEAGELVELRSGSFVLTAKSREFAAGRLSKHRDGYAFVVPSKPIPGLSGDIFIPAPSAAAAMHGDRVLARISRIEASGRAEGEIVSVLKRAHATVAGEFRVGRLGNFVVPHDDRLREWIDIPAGMEIPPPSAEFNRVGAAPPRIETPEDLDGFLVDVEILEYPADGQRGEGRVIEILGRPGDFGIDVEMVIRKHHLPNRFPAEALAQAAAITPSIPDSDLAGRRDFRGMEIVTIDGETARDFDDAVWVDRAPGGNYLLDVHIADVSHYVRPGTPIDLEARLRGTSVYFPDRAIPMLPVELSTDICSLRPQVDRLVFSALMEFDPKGDLVSCEFTRGVIRSVERMTYTDVHKLLEGDAAVRERYRALVPRFEMMRDFAMVLNRKRVRRGSIDFDLPEPLIEFNEWGEMTGVARAPRNIAHRIVEEFMLAANEAVAERLEAAGPSIYRIHEQPDPKRVMEFEEIAAHFGYSLGIGAIPVRKFSYTEKRAGGRRERRETMLAEPSPRISPRNYQKLIAQIEGKPEERILSHQMLRSLKQAKYSEDNVGHFALAAKSYTHFTSPIRRYPDLIVHRLLSGAGPPADELNPIAADCSRSERAAADAERELVDWKKIKFMRERLGDEFNALATGVTKYGVFVELEDLFIEGLIPIGELPGDRYTFRESLRKIVGSNTRTTFAIGDRLRVRLDRVDEDERKLRFAIAKPERRGKHRRSW